MLEYVQGFVEQFLSMLVEILPTSPFQAFIRLSSEMPYISYLNWFVPVGQLIAIGTAWLTSIGLFYTYSVIMRWIRLIS